ncbi:MAG: hypothetical protein HOP17_09210 [Acidobacteria bacterium]|nr:hypothetical protein [Acidobacteriota bacterium]
MQKLNLNETADEPTVEKSFWRRQFQAESTRAQKKFDWTFGVVLPVICFAFDPVVFKGSSLGAATYGAYKPFAYLLSFTSIMAMMAWLIWGDRLKSISSLMGGLFILGSVVSFAVGLVMLPLSLVGLIVLIGALGFTPLLTGIVYLRNGVRAVRSAKALLPGRTLVYATTLAALFSFTIPFVINVEINRSIQNIKFGDENVAAAEARKLRLLSPLVNFDVLANECFVESDGEPRALKMQIIAALYADMTGHRVEERRWQFD